MTASTATTPAFHRIAVAAAVTLLASAALAEEVATRRAVGVPSELSIRRPEAAGSQTTACPGQRGAGRAVHCILTATRPHGRGK